MRRIHFVSLGCLALIVLLGLSGCGSARRSEPLAGPVRLEETGLVEGRQVFLTHCQQCHPGGEGGLGPALNNKPLPGFLIRLQVRQGLGVMPPFPEDQISGKEMEDLISYLKVLRRHRPEEVEESAGEGASEPEDG